MIYAKAIISFGPHAYRAELIEEGWRSETPEIANSLNAVAHPGQFGPADGDPYACAAQKARELGADVELTPLEPMPADTIF